MAKERLETQRWHLSNRADPRARVLADRHYNRQKIGAKQFVPPGRCLVLLTEKADALWITSWPFGQYVQHAWPGAWVCSCFRNESEHLSSDLIKEAVAATRAFFGAAPKQGMITFVDPDKTKKKTRSWKVLPQGRMVRRRRNAGWPRDAATRAAGDADGPRSTADDHRG